MDTVVTLISPSGFRTEPLRLAAEALGAAVDWLDLGRACDLFTHLAPGEAERRSREALGPGIDVIAQPVGARRKALLVADMESTIIENEMLDELADELGLRDAISAITARAMAGELDFEGAIRERVAMLGGLEAAALERARAKIRFMPGARALVATMRANGARCALVSGGFTYYTGWVRQTLGFDLDQANTLAVAGGKLTGEVAPPILGRDAKRAALERLAAEQGIPLAATLAVGDGANDLDMLAAAGLGVAFRAKPLVAETARARVDHADLTALLYMQGYRRGDIVA